MISFFRMTSRFKRSGLEITSASPCVYRWEFDPIMTEKLPSEVTFRVAAGKKAYDVIRRCQDRGYFFSQKIINVLSQFVDMSDKCYPISIEGIKEQYYVIYNLDACPYLNRDEETYRCDPRYFCIQSPSPIFGVEDTLFIVVSEDVKNALLKNKVSNIELVESFGCSFEEYQKIRESGVQPEVHVYEDR